MKYHLFFILLLFPFLVTCQTKSHYDETLTGQLPNCAQTEWIFSTEKSIPNENYFNSSVRNADLLLRDSIILYTTKSQRIVALNSNKGILEWYSKPHPKIILSVIADSSSVYYAYTLNKDTLAVIALELKNGNQKWVQYFDNTLIPTDTISKGFSTSYYNKNDTTNLLSFNNGHLLLTLAKNEWAFKQPDPYIYTIDKNSGKIFEKGRLKIQKTSFLPQDNTYLEKSYLMADYKNKKAFLFGRVGIQELSTHKGDTTYLNIKTLAINNEWFVREHHLDLFGTAFNGKNQWKYNLPTSVGNSVNLLIKDTLLLAPLDYVCMGNPCYSKLSILDVRTGKEIIKEQLLGYSHPTAVNLFNNKYYIALNPEPVSIENKTYSYILEIEIPSGRFLRIFRTGREQIIERFLIKDNKFIILNSNGEIISMKLLGE